MRLSLGFSPCPNDTFIFDAMIHHKVDTEGIDFDVFFDDVESLNHKVFKAEPDISKLSFHAFAYATEQYCLLNAGSALGFGVGPLLISKNPQYPEWLIDPSGKPAQASEKRNRLRVGIPGTYTTANFLLGLAFPYLTNKTLLNFSDIEDNLIDGAIDLGLIIHENRFTYQEKNLHKVIDLGDFWEQETHCPIPLGGIVVKRSLDIKVKQTLDRVLRRSIEFAFQHPQSGIDFIRTHAQAMSEAVMYKHIELYVNDFSLDLGHVGRNAIQTLFDKANALGIIPTIQEPIFFDS